MSLVLELPLNVCVLVCVCVCTGVGRVQSPVTYTCQEMAVLLRRWLLKKSNLNVSTQTWEE